MSLLKPNLTERFLSFVGEADFPCVGAKTALNKSQIHVNQYDDIRCPLNETDMLASIHQFVESFFFLRGRLYELGSKFFLEEKLNEK